MSFWKVLGGAAGAVAAVVALPIAGPVGTITAIGALVAGSVGAAAGGVAAAIDDSEERAEERGRQQAKAEYAARLRKLEEGLQAAVSRLTEQRQLFDLIIAMEAVGLACAACDGAVSAEEQRQIDEFVAGASSSALPESVRQQIAFMASNPPDIKTAYQLALDVSPQSMSLFDEIVVFVSHVDGVIDPREQDFIAQWTQLRAA